MSVAAPTAAYNWYKGLYAQDTWTVNRKLTLSVGLRWEMPGAIAERHNNATVLLPDYVSEAGIRGTMALVNSPQWGRITTQPILNGLVSPRLGFAYRLKDDLVVRGGYSLAYITPDLGGVFPGASFVNSAGTTASNASDAVSYTVANPFGSMAINKPVGRAWESNFVSTYQATYANKNQTISGTVPTNKFPYMQQWNLVIGKQFNGQSIEIGYAGALDTHILPAGGNWGLDQPSATQMASIKACKTATPACSDATARAAYTPFPAYKNVTNSNNYNSTVNYNSMQVRYEKRFKSGGLITSGYTWAKALGDADTTMTFLDNQGNGLPQDYNNIKGEHSILSWSMRHRWVTSYVIPLPFGKGKMFLKNLNGFADRVVGGWEVNGITTLMSGQPLMLKAGTNQLNNWNIGTLRPNYVPTGTKVYTNTTTLATYTLQCNGRKQGITDAQSAGLTAIGVSATKLDFVFNPACFAVPGTWEFGNQPRVDSGILASGAANWDFTLSKKTAITERVNTVFRAEFFNVFNRRQWLRPGLDASASGAFGKSTDQYNGPRQLQFSLRVAF